jgi:two-component system alkaline phosphatase synthesis response regulator PhoP
MRILLVEDDPLNVELFTAVLEDDGHEMTVERDGQAGRDRALRESFDLVILDIQLPHLRGDAVCRELRAAHLTMPIIGLSAEALPEQSTRNRSAGFDAYLTKPIEPPNLREAVRRAGRRSETVDERR